MVYRVYTEKKEGLSPESEALFAELRDILGVVGLTSLRLFNRYDVEGITPALFERAVKTVFSEPRTDRVYFELPSGDFAAVFAVEYLPGQYDQRADSAAQCIQLISGGDRPTIKTARVYALSGKISGGELAAIKKYLINPVESREASMDKPSTLTAKVLPPEDVEILFGFNSLDENGLAEIIKTYGLAMDLDDLKFFQNYFISERREPTLAELRVADTYWSDHCRHTTFLTSLDSIEIADRKISMAYGCYLALRRELGRENRPVTLMDMATIGAKYLKHKGKLTDLDESDEINACTVKTKVTVDGKEQDWLLLFKNETHNHPTEIEPFGGAATCIGGAIRDPLSGRSYVYQAMRVTGASDPRTPLSQTLKGKLPQRRITQAAAAGYSSYGNQIGLATGKVDEIYHPGYAAKRMEIGAVLGAAPAANVVRKTPTPGDVVILLGGRTGRDGCGGATGSSKSHDLSSLENCGAEVQKGNAPEERKLQRLFRNPEAARLIKRCNDFGAGGVSVAVGELADGLDIDLNAVPKKYEGLSGIELAISESQERMAVVVSEADCERFISLAGEENLEATVIARVTKEPVMRMLWKGREIVNLKRSFLNSNGAQKHARAYVNDAEEAAARFLPGFEFENYKKAFFDMAGDLNVCSKRGLSERFDSTIGSGCVLMPFGGKHQLTPIAAMVSKFPVLKGDTDDCSFMSHGFNPYISEQSPFAGAYLAVVDSLAKLAVTGADMDTVHLTFQEYFEKLGRSPEKWGKPVAALLGALCAQLDFEVASIGGKDSMSGSFENLSVPPTLVSFAVATGKVKNVTSPEFKKTGSKVVALLPESKNGLPHPDKLKENFKTVERLIREGRVLAANTVGYGGVAGAVMKMCFGNGIGFEFDKNFSSPEKLFAYNYGGMVLEVEEGVEIGEPVGHTNDTNYIQIAQEKIDLQTLLCAWEKPLESVFPTKKVPVSPHPSTYFCKKKTDLLPNRPQKSPKILINPAKIRVLIPVFPGTNCEYDSAKAFEKSGALADMIVLKNLTPQAVSASVDEFVNRLKSSQIVFIPGGFSAGDEPDGSGKFITAFFRNPRISETINTLLRQKDALICGICNGFQALIKLGLVPYGEIVDYSQNDAEKRDNSPEKVAKSPENAPTLTFNTIGRHQSRLVRIRVSSNLSPWLSKTTPGEIFTVPISHGEGRFICDPDMLKTLAENGQIATQYVDLEGNISNDILFNPNGSTDAIEGITSPDGRVFGKMGHSERIGDGLYKNVGGRFDMGMFDAAVEYFKL